MAFLSSVMTKLEPLVAEQAGVECGLLSNVQQEAKKLKDTLQLIEGLLQDADAKQMHQNSVKAWMNALKHIICDAENALDDWETTRVADDTGIADKVFTYLLSLCSCFQPVFSCLSSGDNFRPVAVCYTAHKIKAIRDRLDSLTRDMHRLGIIPIPTQEDNRPRLLSTSLVDVSKICGREVEKETIMSWLTGESSQQVTQVHVPVISIVGMGGLGKTTLAQLIYKDDTIASTFQLRMWVCVSKPFYREGVFMEIIKLAGGTANNSSSLQALQQSLCTSIHGKQFLLVLDDVWSEDPNDWEPIKLSLQLGAPGSRIIVTTRNVGVANMMGSEHTYSLGQLTKDDSSSLFWKIASSGRLPEELHEFKEVGAKIAKKCKGVPLVIKTVASLVRLKRSNEEWRNVLESEAWDLKMVNNIFPALLLSYYDLSPSLKQCFLYCAIFRKDTELKRDELVQLWMAQGYLGLDEEKELEIIGVEYFEDLAMRSFFQDLRIDWHGKVKCKMHDLVHDLAQSLTESECTIIENNDTPSGISYFRHINTYELHSKNPSILKSRNMRSLFIISEINLESHMLRNHLRYLRVLSLCYSSFKNLPDEVGGLSHLRYIDLSWSVKLQKLPETVCNLLNLQTLKLGGCSDLRELPEEIGKLSKLRHLEIEETEMLNYLPRSIEKLRCLRSVSKFIVGPVGKGCGVGELRDLNCLRGTLGIKGLKHIRGGVDEAKQAQLWNKRNLIWLNLEFDGLLDIDGNEDVTSEEDAIIKKRVGGTLEGLQPHGSLQKLGIGLYEGLAFPSWMSLLSNVVELRLYECKNCIQLPAALGSLESLEILGINNCESLKHIGVNAAASGNGKSTNLVLFPKLKKLTLENLPNWEEEIEETNGAASTRASTMSIMPSLRYLCIQDCPKLKVVPNYLFSPSLRNLCLRIFPQLMDTQPCLPQLLELLFLDGDVGVLSVSLLPIIAHHSNTTYPKLKYVEIWNSLCSSLPQGLNEFTSLQELGIRDCIYMDLKPEDDLRHFPMLQLLDISRCPIIENRCSMENWRNFLCHQVLYNIKINYKKI